MSRQIQHGINLGDRGSLWAVSNFFDLVSGPNLSLLQHAEVKPGSVMSNEEGWHPRLIHPNSDTVASYARLGDFKYCAANAISIANTDLTIREPLDGKIFSELAETKIIAPQEALPIMVRIHLVDEHRTLLAAVAREIPLPVSIDIELTNETPPLNRTFPDRRTDSLTVPSHVAGKADIY